MGIPAKTSSFSTGSFLAFREKKKKKKNGSPGLTQLLRCHWGFSEFLLAPGIH